MTRRPARALVASIAALATAVAVPVVVAGVVGGTQASAAVLRTATAPTLAWRAQARSTLVVGRSVGGRVIVARRQGPADAPKVLLVVGQMHGSEPAGRSVVGKVRTMSPPKGVQVWTISTMNPDGSVRRTRQNARGVDLNRNFPQGWQRTYSSRVYYPGPVSLSEPESRAMVRFLDALRPDLIVSLHQAARSIDLGNPKTRLWAVRLARAFQLPTRTVSCAGPCAGTMMGWYNAYYAGFGVTVELPGRVTSSMAGFYARAALSVGAMLVRTAAPTPTPTSTSPSPTATSVTPTPSDTATTAPAAVEPLDTPSVAQTVGASVAP